jgi:glycosyltransferase involved in cell wall biosynthesis
MKVIYDTQIFAEQEFGGISRYFCSLAAELVRLPDAEVRIVAALHVNGYLKELGRGIAAGLYVRRLPKTGRMIKALGGALFEPVAAMMRPDIVHETYYSPRSTYGGRVPHVLTVYDMIHERFPGSFAVNDPVASYKASAVHRADHIFCISENTRRDLLEIHNLPEDRITVTYLGYDALAVSSLTAAELVGDSPYLLHVGGRQGYKNFDGLLRAYAASNWLHTNFRVVCFGGGAFSALEKGLIAELGLSDAQVMQMGGADDRLAALYRSAAAFVYPSMYEGFGIPPLEAMSLDCPVICSNTSSIPEVVGDAGEYFDPANTASIREALERVLQSGARRNRLVELGRVRCKLFSWERCAQETMAVYRRLAK